MSGNGYDDFRPDVSGLLAAQDKTATARPPGARSGDGLGLLGGLASRVRLAALGGLVLTGWHRALMYANLRLGWFEEFQRYWVSELGTARCIRTTSIICTACTGSGCNRSRPISHDARQLESWRDHRIVYYLFSHAIARPCRRCACSATPASSPGTGGSRSTAAARRRS